VSEPVTVIEVLLQQLEPDLELPSYAHPGDAGADLYSRESFELQPGERRLVGTGVAIALPAGYAAFVHPRSGLAAQHGVSIVNTPGTVDAGYRGEIKVCLINTDRRHPVSIARGDRIAQLIIQQVSVAAFVTVDELPGSARGIGGYGSTGGVLGSAAQGGAAQGGAAQGGAAQGGAAHGGAAQGGAAQGGAAHGGAAHGGAAERGAAERGVTEPEVTEPEVTEPGAAEQWTVAQGPTEQATSQRDYESVSVPRERA
jgi:dUTP pyrophosphatase